jgi:16S rRNA G966 N2-methylase RsmD
MSVFESLLSDKVQSFIAAHENDDPTGILLKHSTIAEVPTNVVVQQIIGRQKARRKLPHYYSTGGLIYPPGLNLEQASSETTAIFKRTYLSSLLPASAFVADLTGGFGVDTFYFSLGFAQVDYVERDDSLVSIARHNHQRLRTINIRHFNQDAADYLASQQGHIDAIFIDPARRDLAGKKVFTLSDCQPNVLSLVDLIFEKSHLLLIKAAPMLDIQMAIRQLKYVRHVHAVSVDNECRELLFTCERDFDGDPVIEAVNLKHHGFDSFRFYHREEAAAVSVFSPPLRYLYVPNASILKAGALKLVGSRYQMAKLHPSTHLYTTDDLSVDFPGNIYHLIENVKPGSTALKTFFPDGKANVITRNYPLTPVALKKRLKLSDGGEKFLIGASGLKEKYLLVAEKVKV